ncbi:hypothetical protein CMI37_12095 [Candidatus Pacearchaeota archaeon]|nr:hypothetical protein [Candidatus Pacearchaeota archaeon]
MDSVKLSVAVCHTPGIASERDDLVKRLRRQYPELTIVHDYDREGSWPSTLKASRAITPGATHHMIMHDHAYIPDGAPEALIRAIEARPDDVLAPYTPRNFVHKVVGAWCRMNGVWGTAVVAPVQLWDEFRSWALNWTMSAPSTSADRRIGVWLIGTGRDAIVPIPSLVTHTGVKSLLGHPRTTPRRAAILFGDRPEPAWSEWHDNGPLFPTTPLTDLVKCIDPDKIGKWFNMVAKLK